MGSSKKGIDKKTAFLNKKANLFLSFLFIVILIIINITQIKSRIGRK